MTNFIDLIRAFSAAQSNIETAIENIDKVFQKLFNGTAEPAVDGLLDKIDDSIATLESIASHAGGGGGGGGAFIVNCTQSGGVFSVDKTNAEIYNAFTSNQIVVLNYMVSEANYLTFNMVVANDANAVFTQCYIQDNHLVCNCVEVATYQGTQDVELQTKTIS